MITLQVPEGEKCEGCMFLSVHFWNDTASCMLFDEGNLSAQRKHGDIDPSTIKKCDRCSESSKIVAFPLPRDLER
jgi:hypothetical protein